MFKRQACCQSELHPEILEALFNYEKSKAQGIIVGASFPSQGNYVNVKLGDWGSADGFW